MKTANFGSFVLSHVECCLHQKFISGVLLSSVWYKFCKNK